MSKSTAARNDHEFPDLDLTSLLDGIDTLASYEAELAEMELTLADIETATS